MANLRVKFNDPQAAQHFKDVLERLNHKKLNPIYSMVRLKCNDLVVSCDIPSAVYATALMPQIRELNAIDVEF